MSWPLGNVMSAWHPGLSSSRLCSVAQIRVRILYLLGPFSEWLAISLASSASHTLSTRGWARLTVDAQNCPSLSSHHVLIIPLWGVEEDEKCHRVPPFTTTVQKLERTMERCDWRLGLSYSSKYGLLLLSAGERLVGKSW